MVLRIILYGLFIGVILFSLPVTRKLGSNLIALVGLFFVFVSILIFLGGFLGAIMPIILVIAAIYGVYYLATNKGKPTKEQYDKMELSEKINFLIRTEFVPKNEKYNIWLNNINNKDSKYNSLLTILDIDENILNTYNKANELINTLENMKVNYNTIINRYKLVLDFNEYISKVSEDKIIDNIFSSNYILDLEKYIKIQNEVFIEIKNFDSLVNDNYKLIVESFLREGLNNKKLFIIGEYRVEPCYQSLEDMFNDSFNSLFKAYKLLTSQVNMQEEFKNSIGIIEKVLQQVNILREDVNNDINKIKAIIYLAYGNNSIAHDIEKARDNFVLNLYENIGNMSESELITFEEFEEDIVGKGSYFKKRFEQWVRVTGGNSVYSFRIQYKNYIIFIFDGVIVDIKIGNMED